MLQRKILEQSIVCRQAILNRGVASVLGQPPSNRGRRPAPRLDWTRGRRRSVPGSRPANERAHPESPPARASRDRFAPAPARCASAPGRPSPDRSAPARPLGRPGRPPARQHAPCQQRQRASRAHPQKRAAVRPRFDRRSSSLRRSLCPLLIAHLRIRRSGIRRRPARQRATSMDAQPASLTFVAEGTRHARHAPRWPTSRFADAHIGGSPALSVSPGRCRAPPRLPRRRPHATRCRPAPPESGRYCEVRHQRVIADVEHLARPPLVLLAAIEAPAGRSALPRPASCRRASSESPQRLGAVAA